MNSQEMRDKTIAMRTGAIKMKRDREFWTEAERTYVEKQFLDGVPINEIAIELERSETAVQQQIQQMNLYVRSPETMRKRHVKPQEPICLCSVCSCDRSLCPLCEAYQAIQEGA